MNPPYKALHSGVDVGQRGVGAGLKPAPTQFALREPHIFQLSEVEFGFIVEEIFFTLIHKNLVDDELLNHPICSIR